MAAAKTTAFTTIANFANMLDNLCNQTAPKRKPLAIKTKVKKATAKNAEGPATKAAGANKTKGKKKEASMAHKAKWQLAAEKKRVHSKAYHAAYTNARTEGKGAEEAKALARKAGTEAARAFAASIKA